MTNIYSKADHDVFYVRIAETAEVVVVTGGGFYVRV